MKPDTRFLRLPKNFWSLVRLIGQGCGYARNGNILIPKRCVVEEFLIGLGLKTDILEHLLPDGNPMWQTLLDYFTARRDLLHFHVEPNLMNAQQAKKEFTSLKRKFRPTCPLPMNKQSGTKKAPAYLTGMVNMLIEKHANGNSCDYDPRALTTVTVDGFPVRTFARRMDGAFPSVVSPVAVWEIKEYYYTTTFGSRVADGVYETLLDGLEIEELAANESIYIFHYLIIDARYTWWDCGKSYLCRIVDMLHMGYVDEVLVGREVISRLPELVESWIQQVNQSLRP